MDTELHFNTIVDALSERNDAVALGKMMSSPGITYKGKVFAFYHNDAMTFKLGEAYDPAEDGITDFGLLSPFKSKPPMRAWFIIPATHSDQWQSLAEKALARMQAELDK